MNPKEGLGRPESNEQQLRDIAELTDQLGKKSEAGELTLQDRAKLAEAYAVLGTLIVNFIGLQFALVAEAVPNIGKLVDQWNKNGFSLTEIWTQMPTTTLGFTACFAVLLYAKLRKMI